MQKQYRIKVDITKKYAMPAFEVNTNDLKSIRLSIEVLNGASPLDLKDKTVRIAIRKPDNNIVFQDCTITDATNGQVEVILENQAYITPGTHTAEIMCYKGKDVVAVSGTFSYKSSKGIMNDEAVESKSEFTAITKQLADVQATVTDLRKNGTGIDAQARQEVEQVSTRLVENVQLTPFSDINTVIKNNTTYSNGVYTVNNRILLDGTSLKRKKLTLQFNSEIRFKVSDSLENGTHAFQISNFDSIEITGLKIDGNLQDNNTSFAKNGQALSNSNAHQVGNCLLWINDCKKASVEKCELNNSSYIALFFKRADDINVENVVTTNCFNGGVCADIFSKRCTIRNNYIQGTGDRGKILNYTSSGMGILASNGSRVIVENNKIYDWCDTGTKTQGCDYVRFVKNDVQNFGKDGVKVMGSEDSTNYPNSINVRNAEVTHNFIKNRFDGRPDGSSYILLHEVTNGIVDGNVVIKDNDMEGVHDGIRVNIGKGNKSEDVKIINNKIDLNGNYNSFYVDGASGIINDVSVRNNTFSARATVSKVNGITIADNKFTNCILSTTNNLNLSGVKNFSITNNSFDDSSQQYIYAQISNGMDYIEISRNRFGATHARVISIAGNNFRADEKIKELKIENNTVSDFSLRTINYPAAAFYVNGAELKVDVLKVKNNNVTKTSDNSINSVFWFHNATNQKALITEYENNLLNLVHAEINNSHSQLGRLIGKPVMTSTPNYTSGFQNGDIVYKKTTNNDKILWKFINGAWTESY